MGAEAVKTMLAMPRGSLAPVNFRSRVLKLARRAPARERVAQAMELVKQEPKAVGVTEWTFAKETVMLDHLIRREPVADVEVQAIQVGPAVFVVADDAEGCARAVGRGDHAAKLIGDQPAPIGGAGALVPRDEIVEVQGKGLARLVS